MEYMISMHEPDRTIIQGSRIQTESGSQKGAAGKGARNVFEPVRVVGKGADIGSFLAGLEPGCFLAGPGQD
jgi:hypothetical protein